MVGCFPSCIPACKSLCTVSLKEFKTLYDLAPKVTISSDFHSKGIPGQALACQLTPGPRQGSTNLSDDVQQFSVGVEDDTEWQEQAEREQADDVGDVVGRLGPPVHRAGCAGTLGPVPAPAQQRRHGPGERVEPGEADPSQHGPVVSVAGYGGRHHGAVTLVGQDGEGYQRDDACGCRGRHGKIK